MAKPNHFCSGYIWTFWNFDTSVWSGEKILPFRAVPTDTSWRQQALSATLKQHLEGSGDVKECLLVSDCFYWRQLVHEWCLNDVLGVFGWCLWMFVVLGCVWGVIWLLIPCRVENLHCFGTALNGKIFSPVHTEVSKYQNVHIYPEQKWLGFAIF